VTGAVEPALLAKKPAATAPRPTSCERTIQFSRTERKSPSVWGPKNLGDPFPPVNRKLSSFFERLSFAFAEFASARSRQTSELLCRPRATHLPPLLRDALRDSARGLSARPTAGARSSIP
jgi:hypothetical protein